MFNPMEAMFGGVQVVVVVFGLVEFIKNVLNLSGTKVTVLAAVLGAVVYGLVQLVGVVPEPYGQVLQIVFASVVMGLTASGYYKFADARISKVSTNRLE